MFNDFRLESVLSNEEYDLIERAMVGKGLNSVEFHRLLLLADKFLARDEALEKIFAFIHVVLFQNIDLSQMRQHMIFYAINHYISRSYPIKFDNTVDELVLEGEDIMIDSKDGSFKFFSFCVPHCHRIRVKDFPLHKEDCQIIQSKLHSHITSVSFVNCEFLFDFRFDFSQLTDLSHFEFVNCKVENLPTILETIPSTALRYLDLSSTKVDLSQNEQLMRCLLKFEGLETFKYNLDSGNEELFLSDILSLPSLKHLEVRRASDMKSFVDKLEQLKEPLNLEYLDISKYNLFEQIERFLRNADKLPKLRYLNISTFDNLIKVRSLIDERNHHCCFENLKEIVVELGRTDMIDLQRKIREYHIDLKIHPTRYHAVQSLDEFYYYENVSLLSYNIDAHIITDIKDFDNVLGLVVDLRRFLELPHELCRTFFSKFTKVEELTIYADDKCNFDYLELLVLNNPVRNIKLNMSDETRRPEALANALKNAHFKKFDIRAPNILHQLIYSTDAFFWSEIESITQLYFPSQAATFLFKNFQLPKLKELYIRIQKEPLPDVILAPIFTVRKIIIIQPNDSIRPESLVLESLLRLFPNIIELNIYDGYDYDLPNIAELCPNLRRVKMKCNPYSNRQEIYQTFLQLPLIAKVDIEFLDIPNSDN